MSGYVYIIFTNSIAYLRTYLWFHLVDGLGASLQIVPMASFMLNPSLFTPWALCVHFAVVVLLIIDQTEWIHVLCFKLDSVAYHVVRTLELATFFCNNGTTCNSIRQNTWRVRY